MKIRILSISETDQKILKLKADGLDDGAISMITGETLDHVKAMNIWVERGLSNRWRKTAAECWKIIKEWNAASSLILFLCLSPLIFGGQDVIRARTRPPTVRVVRVARRKD